MTDEKQIEEMAKDITKIEFPENHPNVAVANEFEALIEAKALYKKGYRKLPENAVVLTREEYEYLMEPNSTYEPLKELSNKILELLFSKKIKLLEQARKETAREILNEIKISATWEDEQGNIEWYLSKKRFDELVKENGVEVDSE